MATVGIICEYNPFHNGHKKQLEMIRLHFGPETRIVCLMSGNYVQRGEPAVFEKTVRAAAAAACGADVVLELPVVYALSSAERFAAGGVDILTRLGVEYLCFGCETGNTALLQKTAKALLLPATDERIREELKTGISYAAARERALCAECPDGAGLLHNPNDILAVEYCKAILRLRSPMRVFPITRSGRYASLEPDAENPSAASLRELLAKGGSISGFVPEKAVAFFENAKRYSLNAGERAVLARLCCMSDLDFAAVPFGSEGLWRRFMHASRAEYDVRTVIDKVKSKRYARSRIQRMLMCACLGITSSELETEAPYVRILAFSEQGRSVLRAMQKKELPLVSRTETVRGSAFYDLEQRCEQMFRLFSEDGPKAETGEKA